MSFKSRPVLYLAATGHGFGHAVRLASIAAAIASLDPDILLVMVTTAPRWLLESYIEGDFIYRPRAFDVGVVQSDSLTMDKTATLSKMQEIYSKRNALIAAEVNFIQTNRVSLILADIPPLATLIAKKAGIPSWMVGNFGWDFIYRAWGEPFQEITLWIEQCYQQCDRLFRLPLSESMHSFPSMTDVGLTGGTPRYSLAVLRDKFALTVSVEKTILLTFGGLGLTQIPYENLAQFPDWQFITFDRSAPNLPNLRKISESHFRPVDFMPLCGRVVSKPGYSTFAEALRLEVPLVSLTRDDFAEAPLLLKGIQNHAYHQIIDHHEFFAGDWSFLRQDLHPPLLGTTLAKDGSEAIAREVVAYINSVNV